MARTLAELVLRTIGLSTVNTDDLRPCDDEREDRSEAEEERPRERCGDHDALDDLVSRCVSGS